MQTLDYNMLFPLTLVNLGEPKNENQFSISIWQDIFLDQAMRVLDKKKKCFRETCWNTMFNWKYPKMDGHYYSM